jgi:hypothetical protein
MRSKRFFRNRQFLPGQNVFLPIQAADLAPQAIEMERFRDWHMSRKACRGPLQLREKRQWQIDPPS